MINWKGNSGGVAVFITFFLALMAEQWIMGNDDMTTAGEMIEGQARALEVIRKEIRTEGRIYRYEVETHGLGHWILNYSLKRMAEYREAEAAILAAIDYLTDRQAEEAEPYVMRHGITEADYPPVPGAV